MKKESTKITLLIEQLTKEKNELREQLKNIPQGTIRKKYNGHSIRTGAPTYINELTYKNSPISSENLRELRKQAIEHNTPILNRLKEIDENLSQLNGRLKTVRVNELLTSDEIEGQTTKTVKSKQDTRPKDKQNFIDTFIEKSKEIVFNNQKDIAKSCNVSPTWITNHFNLVFLSELFEEMDKEYNELVKRESKIQYYASYEETNQNEIFEQNFAYLRKLLEDKKDKAKFDNARNKLKNKVYKKT